MCRKSEISFSGESSSAFLGADTPRIPVKRMGSSDELVWVKRTFFTLWRILNTVKWKNMVDEAKITIKQSARTARLYGRIAGEGTYA